MRTCVVKGCKSKRSKGSSITFHALPSDETRRKLWWSSILPKRSLKDSTAICALHFDPEDYNEINRLKVGAVPWDPRVVCRICLATHHKVFDLQDRRLQEAYNDVSGITVTSDDCLPQVLCWECCARVLAAARLRSRAQAAHRTLEGLLETHGSITREAVSSVNTRANNLATQLSCKYIDSNDYYAYIIEDTEPNDLKPKDNVDINDEIQPEFEDFVDENHDIDEDRIDVIEEIDEEYFEENDEIKDDKESDAKNDKGDDNDAVESNDCVSDDDDDDDDDDDVKSKLENTTNDTSIQKQADETKLVLKYFRVTKVNLAEEIAALERRKESAEYKTSFYKCDVCYRYYKCEARYHNHIVKHSDKYGMFECSVCKTRYATKGRLRSHTAAFHFKKYNCIKCTFVTNHRTTARYHKKFHDGIIFKCPHCPKQFQMATTYYSHLRLKHPCAEVCEYCGHTFRNKSGAMRHKNIVHKFDKDTVPLEGPYCDRCDVTFASQQAYDKHLIMSSKHRKEDESQDPITNAYQLPTITRKNPDEKRVKHPVECEQCGLTLSSRNLYAWHFRNKHPGLIRTQGPIKSSADVMCEQCGRKFRNMAQLKDHKWIHTGKKIFKCDLCDKAFTKKGYLALHVKIHSPTRPSFECPICGKLFPYFHNRNRHMFIHTGLKPYKCETCGRSFTTSGEKRSHVEHVHLEMPWPRRDRTRGRQTQPSQEDLDPMED